MNVAIDIVSDLVCPVVFHRQSALERRAGASEGKAPGCRVPDQLAAVFPEPGHAEGRGVLSRLPRKQVRRGERCRQNPGQRGRSRTRSRRRGSGSIASPRGRTRCARTGWSTACSRSGTIPTKSNPLVERLFVAHFQRGEDIGDIETLVGIAAECGEDKEGIAEFLASNESEQQVRSLVNKVGILGVTARAVLHLPAPDGRFGRSVVGRARCGHHVVDAASRVMCDQGKPELSRSAAENEKTRSAFLRCGFVRILLLELLFYLVPKKGLELA